MSEPSGDITTRPRGSTVLAVVMIVGALLLFANPIWFYPGMPADFEGHQRTYELEPIENESVANAVLHSNEDVFTCGLSRQCALEEHIVEEGPVEYSYHHHRLGPTLYELVTIRGEFYIPEPRPGTSADELSLEPVTIPEAVDHVAVPVDEAPDEATHAVEAGSVTVYDRTIDLFDRGAIIEDGGEYYWVSSVKGTSGHWAGRYAPIGIRYLLFAVGGVFLFGAGYLLAKRKRIAD